MRTLKYGKTQIVVCDDEYDLGKKAALAVAETLRTLLARQEEVRMVFAAGESQTTFLDALAREPSLDWKRVVCFNMDDFWDTRMPERFTCGRQTRVQLYEKVHPRRFELVRYNAPDPEDEARRFEGLLRQAGPVDILCQGIGTSGHLALNEPGQTDFEDVRWAKVVDVAEQSKRQLRADPNFAALGYIPEKGITLTIPALMSARHIFTMVPLALKCPILTRVLSTPRPTTARPATIISRYAGVLFVDRNSCPVALMARLNR